MHEAEVEGTRSQPPMCLPVAMGNAIATHTEATTKLTTAHKAHHCDDHARSTTRDFSAFPKHRVGHSDLIPVLKNGLRARWEPVSAKRYNLSDPGVHHTPYERLVVSRKVTRPS